MKPTCIKDDARDTILDAADRRFCHYGYRKTTVEEIAQEAGLSRGTVYLHFNSKDELAVAWIGRFLGKRLRRLEEIAQSESPAADRLRRMLVDRILFAFDGAQRLAESLDDLLYSLRQSMRECRDRHHEAEAALVSEVVKEGTERGDFHANDALAVSRLLILATNSLLPYNLSPRQLGCRQEIETRVGALADLLIRGLAAPEK
jgi:AcrR family transcriptional regulator